VRQFTYGRIFCLSVALKLVALNQLTPRYAILTRRYVAYREVLLETKFEKLRAMLHSAESRLRAMQVKINSLIPARNPNRIKKYFRVFIRALGPSIYEKNGGRKSRETVSLTYFLYMQV
jgi:hypothetical protein